MATSITWPADLPQQMLINGYDEQDKKVLIRTEMDAAVAKQRRRFSVTGSDASGSFLMTNAQRASFRTFFKEVLKDGALEFNLPEVGDNDTYRLVRFMGTPPKYTPAGLRWIVSLELERLPE